MTLVEEVSNILGIKYNIPEVHYKHTREPAISADIYKDTHGALELAKVPKLRPRTKHTAL